MNEHPIDTHMEAFRRSAVDLIEEGELRKRVEEASRENRGLRIKLGMDPSSPDLHVGHGILLRKLRDLQDLGHTVVLIVGDATAMVGDPSGRNKLRPQLTREQIQANLETYTEQARIVLDMDRTELHRNSEWFDDMGFEDVLKLTSRMTVAQMIQRDTFQVRMEQNAPIGIHELLYPLMQGWDSVMIRADVELGGTDQLFNLLVGRDLQGQEGQAAQVVLTTPLINGLDGRKMSKSYGNAIALTDPPKEVFGKTMSIADEEMRTWFEHLTRLGSAEIDEILSGHPREAKARLAWELAAWLHGRQAADVARAGFDRQFVEKELPDDIATIAFSGEWSAEGVPLTVLLREAGLTRTGAEGQRLVSQGGVRLDGEVVTDPRHRVARPAEDDTILLQVGKRRFARVRSR